jgi:hypothetical protein
VYLKPFETKSVMFILNQAAPVLRKHEVIIGSRSWGNVYVLPSKSDLEFDFFFIMFIHTKEKKIQCRYESPTEETREEHGYLVVKWKIKGCRCFIRLF